MAFTFRLEFEDGTPADPPVLHTAVPNWQVGDTIPLGRDRTPVENPSFPAGTTPLLPRALATRVDGSLFVRQPALRPGIAA
jgi:hypothetical protein